MVGQTIEDGTSPISPELGKSAFAEVYAALALLDHLGLQFVREAGQFFKR